MKQLMRSLIRSSLRCVRRLLLQTWRARSVATAPRISRALPLVLRPLAALLLTVTTKTLKTLRPNRRPTSTHRCCALVPVRRAARKPTKWSTRRNAAVRAKRRATKPRLEKSRQTRAQPFAAQRKAAATGCGAPCQEFREYQVRAPGWGQAAGPRPRRRPLPHPALPARRRKARRWCNHRRRAQPAIAAATASRRPDVPSEAGRLAAACRCP